MDLRRITTQFYNFCQSQWCFSPMGESAMRESTRVDLAVLAPGLLNIACSVYTVRCLNLSKISCVLENMPWGSGQFGALLPTGTLIQMSGSWGESFLLLAESLVLIVEANPTLGFCCWSPLANLAAEDCKNKKLKINSENKAQKPGCVTVVKCLLLRTLADCDPML